MESVLKVPHILRTVTWEISLIGYIIIIRSLMKN